MSVYMQKLVDAQRIIGEHNSQLDEESRLNWDLILKALKSLGGTTDDALRNVTWEDLQDCGIPRILARRIANDVFRRKHPLTIEELLERYNPRSVDYVYNRLKELSKNKKCIIFTADHTINTVASSRLLKQVIQDEKELDHIMIQGIMHKTYPVGETDDEWYHENPLYEGERLAILGSSNNPTQYLCKHTNFDWAPVPHEIRQLLYLARVSCEIRITCTEDAHRIQELMHSLQASAVDSTQTIPYNLFRSKMQMRYPKAAILLQSLATKNLDPKLQIYKTTEGVGVAPEQSSKEY